MTFETVGYRIHHGGSQSHGKNPAETATAPDLASGHAGGDPVAIRGRPAEISTRLVAPLLVGSITVPRAPHNLPDSIAVPHKPHNLPGSITLPRTPNTPDGSVVAVVTSRSRPAEISTRLVAPLLIGSITVPRKPHDLPGSVALPRTPSVPEASVVSRGYVSKSAGGDFDTPLAPLLIGST
nr:hypothetical protein [Gordonia sp. NB41Y]